MSNSNAGSGYAGDERVEIPATDLDPGEQTLADDAVIGEGGLTDDFSLDSMTDNSIMSTEQAEPYSPPTDPVIEPLANDATGAEVIGGMSRAGGIGELEGLEDDYQGPTPDDHLADKVLAALRADALTSALDVDVLVRDGIVTLRGTVPSLDDAQNAESVAGEVDGVLDVNEELTVQGT